MKKSRLKRVLAGISAAAMAFSLICYAPLNWCAESPYVIKASALAAESGYITDSNGIMSYKFCSYNSSYDSVDLHGVFNGSWKQVTFYNEGFRSVLRVGESTCYPDVQNGTETTSGLSVKFEPVFVSDGKLIQLVYNVTNNSESPVTFDFAIGSDVQIGNCDRAPITKLDKTKDGQETGFLMESYSDYDKNDEGIYAGFGLIMNGAKGANASDFWYGHYGDVGSNMFSTAPANNLTKADNVDSGATVSWKNRTAAPGETVSLSAYVGIGSAEELKALIKEMLSATTDYKNEQLTDLEPNSRYELTITESDGTQTKHPITSTPEGTIPMTGTDYNGDPYTMIGKSSSLVKKGDGESTADSDPITIDIADRPDAPDDPNVPKGTVDDIINPSDVETTGNSITFPSNPNTEYTIDGGNTWVTPDENGNIVFDNLTEGEEYTIQSRTPATDSSPASPISEGVKIVVKNMVTEDDIDISADDLVFTGEPQSIEVICDDPDVTITYSTSLDEEFTSDIPVFTDDGVYTVYYCAEKPGCYPKYGSYTVTIVKTYEFDSAEHWKIINGVRTSVGVHTFGDWKTLTEPDCVTDGRKKHICTVCGYYEFEPIDAEGHTPVSADNAKAPTCTEAGKESDTICDVCGDTIAEGDDIPPTGHDWSTAYTNDTQYHWHECGNTNCPVTADSDKDGYAAHISSGAATEDNDEHCTVCGYVIKPALSHVCQNNVPTFVPEVPETCTTDGVKAHYVCRCGKLYSDLAATVEVTTADLKIPAHHVWSDVWSSDDTQHYHLCSVCGEKNDTAAHTFNDGVVIKEPTEDTEGEKKLTCTVCGYEKTVSIPNIAHVHSYTTQNFDRAYHWNECRCGEISDKAHHIYGDWTITELATPESDGTKERSCVVCGYIQTGVVKYIPDDIVNIP
ncbi:MAG: hypothetical protein J5999_02190 [Oscillospiraceae bacterium]|nr:hypothetical protein [Oscillospiraceae bacterium]